MARFSSLVAVALTSSTALAQPVTRPEHDPCAVTIVVAPDDARREIEAWVRAEPRCERQLEVRVVPTEDGLYLSARDAEGRVRERIVPDARAAAVLVVSWMADDSLGPELPTPVEQRPASPPSAAAVRAELDDELPGEALSQQLDAGIHYRGQKKTHWLSLGALATQHGGLGIRTQLDLIHVDRYTLGIAAGWRQIGDRSSEDGVTQGRIVAGATETFGRISLRAQLGLGLDVATQADRMGTRDLMDPVSRDGGRSIVPVAEAGVLATLRVTDAWGLVGGPVIEATTRDATPHLSVVIGITRGL